MTDTDDLIDAIEAATVLGTTRRHVYSLVEARSIPSYKIGHYVRFKRSELVAYREAQRREVVA